jgi:hypothetical protein
LFGKSEGKRPLERYRHRWDDEIKLGLKGNGWECVDRINLIQDKDKDGLLYKQ